MTSVSPVSTGLSTGLTSGSVGSALAGPSATADGSLANALTGSTTDPLAAAASGGNSGTSSIGDSTSAALQAISNQIAALTSQQAASTVQEFNKTTNDVLYDNNATARSIGQLRLNTSRLNVISALSPSDPVDTFSFTASTTGATKLSALINDPTDTNPNANDSKDVRIQVFAQGKGLVADSDSSAGSAYKNYQALQAGTFDMSAGNYTIKVTRGDGIDSGNKNTYNYALQLTQGDTYTQDYTTTEQAYQKGSDPFGLGVDSNSPGSILAGSMSDAYNFISQLQFGGTGTSKLLGYIYTSSV